MGYYSAVKKSKIGSFVEMWMEKQEPSHSAGENVK